MIMQPLTIFSCHASICQLIGGDVQMWGKGAPKSRPGFKESTSVPDFELHFFGIWNFSKLRTTKTWTLTGFDDFGVPKSHEKKHVISIPGNINNHSYLNYHDDPPSNFSYEMGRTWATVQIASQHFFVQTGGVVPPILYLESFCSWFLSNHAFSFCSCICWVSWSIQHKISLALKH